MLKDNSSVQTPSIEKAPKEKKKLFHVEKRFNMATWQSILIRFGFIIFAVFMGLLVLTMAYGINPFLSFGNLFKGAFGEIFKGNFDNLWEFLRDSALLLGVGLALIPAFKMKFWNLGGNGQIAIGALVCLIMMVELGGKMPDIVVVLISLVVVYRLVKLPHDDITKAVNSMMIKFLFMFYRKSPYLAKILAKLLLIHE